MTRRLHRPRARGITLLEFAIVFPVATLFVLALIQTGLIYMAKLTVNHATFMAARVGATHHASEEVIREAVIRGLSPFYQDSTDTNDLTRLAKAHAASHFDNIPLARPWATRVEVLNPSPEAFADFGVRDSRAHVTYIPNDNLEWRSLENGPRSRMNLRDANLLKIRVTYGYALKVPVVAGMLSRVMCGGTIGVDAYGDVPLWQAVFGPVSQECLRYYMHGRIPIESYAIVQMHSRAETP